MISNVKFNELENRVDLLVNRRLENSRCAHSPKARGRNSSRYDASRNAGG
jgi:hypothetical protein